MGNTGPVDLYRIMRTQTVAGQRPVEVLVVDRITRPTEKRLPHLPASVFPMKPLPLTFIPAPYYTYLNTFGCFVTKIRIPREFAPEARAENDRRGIETDR
ncbi:MAG TPA: hypothetical protein VG345_15370 [Bryobacteraceae bacterium]|nr:hypothetical protein [Bryobacteraceae bacterium]